MLYGAVYNSLANNGSVALDTKSSCSTGDCTWSQYASIGVCATVLDISSMIVKNACDHKALNQVFRDAGIKNPGYPCFNYTLPFDTLNSLETLAADTEFYGNATLSNVVPLLGENTEYPYGMQMLTVSSIMASSNFSFFQGYLMYQPDVQKSINGALSSPLAYSMSLDLCLQTYNISVSDGNISTSIISNQLFETGLVESSPTLGVLNVTGNATLISSNGMSFGVSGAPLTYMTTSIVTSLQDNCFQFINPPYAAIIPFCLNAGLFGTSFIRDINSSDPFSILKRLLHNIANSLSNV